MDIRKLFTEAKPYYYIINTLIERNKLSQFNSVLDIGCGEGTSIFPQLGVFYVAVDSDESIIESLELRLSQLYDSSKYQAIHSDFFKLKLDRKFKLIIASNFLNVIKFEKIMDVLTSISNFLADDGLLFIRVNSDNCSDIKNARQEKEFQVKENPSNKFYIPETGYVKNYFSKSEIEKILESVGFSIVISRYEAEQFPSAKHTGAEHIVVLKKK